MSMSDIDIAQAATLRRIEDGQYLVEILDEYRPLGSQIGHHMVVVNDLVPHINGRTKLLKRTLNNLNGTINTRTKSSGLG